MACLILVSCRVLIFVSLLQNLYSPSALWCGSHKSALHVTYSEVDILMFLICAFFSLPVLELAQWFCIPDPCIWLLEVEVSYLVTSLVFLSPSKATAIPSHEALSSGLGAAVPLSLSLLLPFFLSAQVVISPGAYAY